MAAKKAVEAALERLEQQQDAIAEAEFVRTSKTADYVAQQLVSRSVRPSLTIYRGDVNSRRIRRGFLGYWRGDPLKTHHSTNPKSIAEGWPVHALFAAKDYNVLMLGTAGVLMSISGPLVPQYTDDFESHKFGNDGGYLPDPPLQTYNTVEDWKEGGWPYGNPPEDPRIHTVENGITYYDGNKFFNPLGWFPHRNPAGREAGDEDWIRAAIDDLVP